MTQSNNLQRIYQDLRRRAVGEFGEHCAVELESYLRTRPSRYPTLIMPRSTRTWSHRTRSSRGATTASPQPTANQSRHQRRGPRG